jgi:diguanylate cyclase (GGDEF)-like protein/PAS domain S-box-containing protein
MFFSSSTITALAPRQLTAIVAALAAALLVSAAMFALEAIEHKQAVQEQRLHVLERLSAVRARLEASVEVAITSPLFPALRRTSSGDEFTGATGAPLLLDRLLRESGLPNIEETMNVAIRSRNGTGDNSNIFYGNPEVYAMNPVVQKIMLPGGVWEIAAYPRSGWGMASQTIYLIRIIGLAIGLLAATWVYGLVRHLQLRAEYKQQLGESEARLKLQNNALNAAGNAIVITDNNAHIIWSNKAFSKLTGYSLEEALGRHCGSLIKSGLHDQQFYENMWKTIISGQSWHGEIINRRKDGSLYHDEMTITPVPGDDGRVGNFVAMQRDISERKKVEEQVHQLAFYDTLTQLPNRHLLLDRLGQALTCSQRSGRYGALMFLDLDNFKSLNDKHGHNTGDLLLAEAARRIAGCVRAADTVARFGGDEFVVMLELNADNEVSITQATQVAEKIHAAMAEIYRLPVYQTDGSSTVIEHRCPSSIGIVMFNNHETPKEDILKQADTAMYLAKAAGGNTIRFYNPA